MIGFEINYNGDKRQIGVHEGVATIILTRVISNAKNENRMSATGLDHDRRIKWLDEGLKLGDLITVEVKELAEVTEPQKQKSDSPDEVIKKKLNAYYALKKELEKDGLI